MASLFERDVWIDCDKKKNIQVCYNPAMPHFLLHKHGFFKHILQENDTLDIFEELAQYKSILTNDDKIKTLIVLPNRGYCISFEQDLRKSGFYEHFDFTLKHKTQITLQNKKNNPIEDEVYDLVFIKEDVTIEWLMKKNFSLNGAFFIFLHNNLLTLKSYEHLLNNIKSNKIMSS